MLWPRVLCRLLVKKVAGGTTTIYVYDGAALIAEYDGAGTLLRNHLNLSGVPHSKKV